MQQVRQSNRDQLKRQCIKNQLTADCLFVLCDHLKIKHASSSLHPCAKTQHQAHFELSALCIPCHECDGREYRGGSIMLPKVSIGLMSDASNNAVCAD